MAHPLVLQLRFTRKEFQRALKSVSPEDAVQHIGPINCISWMVGHLAWQEQRYWLTQAQGITPVPEVNKQASGAPQTTPDLNEMWDAWKRVIAASDPWLDTLTSEMMTTHSVLKDGKLSPESIGSRLRRTTYHYWYHTGESQAIRQLLGHTRLPSFIGGIHDEAPYLPEND